MAGKIAAYRVAYRAADLLLIEVQGFANEAGIPAIVELRNAGERALNAVDDGARVVSAAALTKAITHCHRASYQASEAGIVFAAAIIKKFGDDFPTVDVARYCPITSRAAVQRTMRCG